MAADGAAMEVERTLQSKIAYTITAFPMDRRVAYLLNFAFQVRRLAIALIMALAAVSVSWIMSASSAKACVDQKNSKSCAIGKSLDFRAILLSQRRRCRKADIGWRPTVGTRFQGFRQFRAWHCHCILASP